MTILDPEHLLEQADRLTTLRSGGRPRQVDLRRAVSSAYYALFHAILAAAADEFVGVTKRTEPLYGLVYRSINHNAVRSASTEVRKRKLSPRYASLAPASGFGADLQAFAAAILEQYERRVSADYDPMIRVTTSNARLTVGAARNALARFRRVDPVERRAFLALLLFASR